MTVFTGYVLMEGQTGEKKSPVLTLHFKALSLIPSFVVWRSYFCFTQFHDSSTVRILINVLTQLLLMLILFAVEV